MSVTAGDLRCQYNNKDAYCIGCRLKLHYKFSQTETGSFASFPELVTPGGWWLPLPASASAVGDVSARQAIFLVAKIQMLRATEPPENVPSGENALAS